LNYAEHNGIAAIHFSLADLSDGTPQGFADVYADLVNPEDSVLGTPAGDELIRRVLDAVDFVFDNLLVKLHNARSPDIPRFSVADELGLCWDLPGGKSGVEKDLHMRSSFVLEKAWRKFGDGRLASSIRMHAVETLGESAMEQSMLQFLDGHSLQLPNVCSEFLANRELLAELRDTSIGGHRLCFVHGDLHGDNIMVDGRDNRFLIDFGKTGLGHCLEDITWLESHVLLSYTDFATDEELAEVLSLVLALAPPDGISIESCGETALDAVVDSRTETWRTAGGKLVCPRVLAMWSVVKRLRKHLGVTLTNLAAIAPGDRAKEARQVGQMAGLLFLRNSLFFLTARENRDRLRSRKFALALACAYAQAVLPQGQLT